MNIPYVSDVMLRSLEWKVLGVLGGPNLIHR